MSRPVFIHMKRKLHQSSIFQNTVISVRSKKMQHHLKIEKKCLICSDVENFNFYKAFSISIKSTKYVWAEMDMVQVS